MPGRRAEPPISGENVVDEPARRSLPVLLRRHDPWWRWPLVALLSLIALVLAALFAGWLLMRGSLPQTGGVVRLPGLSAPVTVTRDARGMPTIRAQNELDAWRVLGFVEAQDRFVQMDMMRRLAAGRLAALVGPAALPLDRRHRLFRLRAKAKRVYRRASPADRARLEVFALGVNEGLRNLAVEPWPYLLLGKSPQPWEPADSVLAIYAMAFMLEDPRGRRGRSLAVLRELYPRSVVAFLMAADRHWATPMRGELPEPPPIPGTRAVNLAALPPAPLAQGRAPAPATPPGSNNFVVSGRLAKSGHPLLANDMHLPLGIPPTWYRARLVFRSRASAHHRVALTGVFLPGVPALVAGSNGRIAWGFTNSYGDWVDIVRVPTHGNPPVYETPAGSQTVRTYRDAIRINGEKPVAFRYRYTRWGPIVGTAPNGDLLVSHWSVAQPGGVNLRFMHFAGAASVKDALALAARSGIPPQNLLVADRAGHIGWTTIGRIPARFSGCDYSVPQSWADGRCGWSGWLAPGAYPRIVNPDRGFLVTANNRVDASAPGAVLGDGGYAGGARAHQIVVDLERLKARGAITPQELLSVQLDDRAVFLTRWHALILAVLRPSVLEFHPKRKAFRTAVKNWGRHAAVDSVGYRLVREFRHAVARRVFAPVLRRLKARYAGAVLPFAAQKEGPLWRLVSTRPHNWLNPHYATWNALFINVIDSLIHKYWQSGSGLSQATWGRRNTVALTNRFGQALGLLGGWMNWPVLHLPGDTHMPRVQGPTFGASMRLVTRPAPSASAILEVAGGTSEHPLSPWYRAGLMAWAEGKPVALLPGSNAASMRFVPWQGAPRAPVTIGAPATTPHALE